MTEDAPTLKCVIAWSERRNLCDLVGAVLSARVGLEQVRRAGDDSFLAYTIASPAELRNWVAEALEAGESVLVVDFEKWSGSGPGVDAEWLLRRGH